MKFHVISSAAQLFELTEEESERLANQAGLTLREGEDFAVVFYTILAEHAICAKGLHKKANISERMYQYIRKGMHPKKEAVLALALSLGLERNGIDALLRSSGYVLSKSLPNDMVVSYFITKAVPEENHLLSYINETLLELEMPLLMTK